MPMPGGTSGAGEAGGARACPPAGSGRGVPDWRNAGGYRCLAGADARMMAWEWLRRDPEYRPAAHAACSFRGSQERSGSSDPRAEAWGLHRFEDPELGVPLARPVWRAPATFVLAATALPSAPGEDSFDLARLSELSVLLQSSAGEHLLLCDGRRALRIDIIEGTLLTGPARLGYRVDGIASALPALAAIRALVSLLRTGCLGRGSGRAVRDRDILLLRAFDALRAGASQRDIAEHLLGGPLPPNWRIERPSLRSQAQRLARDARALAGGGFWKLL